MNKRSLFTFSFKKNIIFAGKLLLIVGFVLGYFNHVLPQYDGIYSSALIDKVARLKSISEPKIVLIGNSNLTFGMDSAMLENCMGMPVVNMGMHGGMGNAFCEELGKFNVREGDIYVLCHNSYSDDDTIADPTLTWTAIENHYSLWEALRLKDILPMMKAFPNYLKKSLDLYASGTGNEDSGGIYSRSAFNEYGDVKVLREECQITFDKVVNPAPINDIAVDRINRLDAWLTERGATLLVAGYPIGKGEMTADISEFEKFQQELESKLECTVISNYIDYMFDYSYFYDTELHLNSEGAILRTQQLAEDLQQWKNEFSN